MNLTKISNNMSTESPLLTFTNTENLLFNLETSSELIRSEMFNSLKSTGVLKNIVRRASTISIKKESRFGHNKLTVNIMLAFRDQAFSIASPTSLPVIKKIEQILRDSAITKPVSTPEEAFNFLSIEEYRAEVERRMKLLASI